MRLCLINPPHSYLVHPNAQIPLGLLYVAAAAEDAGHIVSVITAGDDNPPGADVYGLTCTSLDWAVDGRNICRALRLIQPEAYIILGGPVSLAPEQVDHDLVDCLVVGDGEEAIALLLSMIDDEEALPQVYYADPVDVRRPRFPARHLWQGSIGGPIFANGKNYFGTDSTVITTSRGCPHKCAFCANPSMSGQKVRFRPVGHVIQEMEEIVVDYGVRQFRLSDETFNVNKKRVGEFCDAIRNSPILGKGIAWKVSTRARPNDLEMYKDMASAGCKEASVGIESADPAVLDVLCKDTTVEDGRKALQDMRKAGIISRALFMSGTPGESEDTLALNLQFFLDMDYDILSLSIFVPFPGCDIRKNPKKYRCDIINDDMETYNLYYYDSKGEREVKPYVDLWDMDYELFSNNVSAMRQAAAGIGRLNRG